MKRLYVESNFVCELVFAQEARHECERVLELAEQQAIEVVLPAFSLAEPLETLGRRHGNRRQLQQGLQRELGQLRRSDHYREEIRGADLTADLLARSAQEDLSRLEAFYRRLGAACYFVALSPQVMSWAFDLQREFDLDMSDAVVLASVSSHLTDTSIPVAFVTKNTKDFDDPGLTDYLESRRCRLLFTFGQALGYALSED